MTTMPNEQEGNSLHVTCLAAHLVVTPHQDHRQKHLHLQTTSSRIMRRTSCSEKVCSCTDACLSLQRFACIPRRQDMTKHESCTRVAGSSAIRATKVQVVTCAGSGMMPAFGCRAIKQLGQALLPCNSFSNAASRRPLVQNEPVVRRGVTRRAATATATSSKLSHAQSVCVHWYLQRYAYWLQSCLCPWKQQQASGSRGWPAFKRWLFSPTTVLLLYLACWRGALLGARRFRQISPNPVCQSTPACLCISCCCVSACL